jgi:hypothetical protein
VNIAFLAKERHMRSIPYFRLEFMLTDETLSLRSRTLRRRTSWKRSMRTSRRRWWWWWNVGNGGLRSIGLKDQCLV